MELPLRLGPFWIGDRLANGPAAEVLLAFHERDGVVEEQPLVLKVLHQFADVRDLREALLREASVQALDRERPVALAEGVWFEDGRRFLVRPYVQGVTVAELLQELHEHEEHPPDGGGRGLPAQVSWAIAVSVLRALVRIHATQSAEGEFLGLVHRDVTPSNLVVTWEGGVDIVDFGLAFCSRASPPLADDSLLQGTRRYLSPESFAGEQPDARTDLFQWALVAGEVLLGVPARTDVDLQAVAEVDIATWLERVREVTRRGGVEALGVVIGEAAHLDREQRPSSARAALAAIELESPPAGEVLAEWLRRGHAELRRRTRQRLEAARAHALKLRGSLR